MSDKADNNFKLQEILKKELFNKHTLSSAILLLECGREMQISYNEKIYHISQSNNEFYLSNNGISQQFLSVYDLVLLSKLDKNYFIEVWDFVEIEYLF